MAEGRLPQRNLIVPFLFPKFRQHKLFQTGNVWKDNFFTSRMKLKESFHVGADFFVYGVLHRDGIVIAGMDMIQIILCDWEHILKEKCGFPAIKLTEDNSEAATIFPYLFIMDRLEFFRTGA